MKEPTESETTPTEPALLLARKFFADPLWTEPRCFSKAEAWIDLLHLAAESVVEGAERGEVVASTRGLSQRWRWSRSTTSRFLLTLVEQERIAITPSSEGGQLRIVNYRRFQDALAGLPQTELFAAPEGKPRVEATAEQKREMAQVRRIWKAFVAERAEILKRLNLKASTIQPNKKRLGEVRKYLRKYGIETVLDAIRGMGLSEYHTGTGRFAGQGHRLHPEAVFHQTSKVNQVELLANLYHKPREKRVDERPKSSIADGQVLPGGMLWSAKLGKASAPIDWSPSVPDDQLPDTPDGFQLANGYRWNAATKRPEMAVAA